MKKSRKRRSPESGEMTDRNLQAWLQRLESAHPTEIELGLERVATVAANLGLDSPSVPVITVAGTNGKGSTVAVMEAVLIAAGRCPGAYTSPHLLAFNERIRVAGEPAGDEDIVAAFEAIEAARGDISLTYFEVATLAALQVFARAGVDILLLEVGLGGRLDAVNLVDADVAVITRIALDHQDWLGDDLDQIALEKAGIMRAGRPVVIADPDAPATLGRRAEELGALAIEPRELEDALPLPPGLIETNVRAALAALAQLPEPPAPEAIVAGLGAVTLSGRRELRDVAGVHYVLDVAHNPDAVNKLLEYLSLNHCNGRTLCVFSVMGDKDIDAMIDAASGAFDAWFLAALPELPRAAQPSDVAARLHQAGQGMISVSKNVRQAFRRAQTLLAPGDRLVIFGSFHTVAAVMPLLDKDERKLAS